MVPPSHVRPQKMCVHGEVASLIVASRRVLHNCSLSDREINVLANTYSRKCGLAISCDLEIWAVCANLPTLPS
jgi:hypothetical protein